MNEIKRKIMEKTGALDGRKFVIVTDENYAGLGFAIKEIEENGSEVIMSYKYSDEYDELSDNDKESLDIQGNGLVEKIALDDLMENRSEYKDWYFIFDMNHNPEENTILRNEGFKVIGSSELTCKLEDDRDFGTKFAEECGLLPPPTFPFTSAEDGIAFLEENEFTSYVLKPNGNSDNSLTYVPINEEPSAANIEMREFIEAYNGDEAMNDYILQEIVKGVEVNVEGYYVNGECVFAHANFENKKNHEHDTGEATGCAFDVDFEIPISSKLFQMTVGKMSEKLRGLNYTGAADANVIIGDFDQVYFLEFCYRNGYNSSINFFYNLCNKTLCQTYADMIDGIPDIKAKSGFGTTITMYTNKQHRGNPIYIPDSVKKDAYFFDAYQEDDKLKMSAIGFGKHPEMLVICAHGYTISETLKECEEKCWKVIFKDRYFRMDTWKHDTWHSPQRRFEAIKAMGLI